MTVVLWVVFTSQIIKFDRISVVCIGDEGVCMMVCDSLSEAEAELQLRSLLHCPEVQTFGNCRLAAGSNRPMDPWQLNCTSDVFPGGTFKGTVSESIFNI